MRFATDGDAAVTSTAPMQMSANNATIIKRSTVHHQRATRLLLVRSKSMTKQ